MFVFIVRRLLQSVVVLAVMSLIVFCGVYVVGNPVDILISPEADQAEIARTMAALGLDKPLWEQYFNFVVGAFSGNLGRSFVYSISAVSLIFERMPATLELVIAAMAIAIVIGIPLGLLAGLKPDSWIGKTIMTGSILGFSLPTFWVGLMMILLFSVQLGWLPSNGRGPTQNVLGIQLSIFSLEGWRYLLMPAMNLALFKLSLITRLTRSGAREALLQDYVRFARAKGLSQARVIGVHVLKNIMIPIVTVIGLEFASTVAFAIVTESIFAWPGMGKLIIDSINVLDRPVIVAYLMIIVTLFIIVNLMVDITYSVLDPRVRVGEGKA
ncbi:ABC transporter permease [soil metagenome]